MTNNKVFILVVAVVLLLFTNFTRSEASYSVPEYLQKVLRMSPDQIGTVMSQPIPDHAQLEIDYGFVDERFVRFMMGVSMIREMLPIEEINYAKSKNKWWKVYDRYSCASQGLDEFAHTISFQYAQHCLYYWTEFLRHGPEISFDFSYPLVEGVEPWKDPTPNEIDFYVNLAKEIAERRQLPPYLSKDIISLQIDTVRLLDVLDTLKEHSREEFSSELKQIEQQPPIARRFGRLICTRDFRSYQNISMPWHRACYAYWYRYVEEQSD
ncbi:MULTISPECIES: hypothetical protein [unclassified Ketobacter]|uniref:hypothetical protein n=1 Tax=unclassified Ketobacter TaxID=2639109 RepID=UPI000F1B748D|nr:MULTISPECIES: hypothetical protein [unclassified Ketobacter]RLT89383.1 MAG: hypothetical protein D9N13_13795 [Ketobacter sp. GenoA1]RLT95770.1 MAG: hypothetical protein D9N15_13055 [Ketobacter sp.]